MAVLQMQKLSICALKKNRKSILEELQSMGVMEMIVDEAKAEDFMKMDTAGQKSIFEKNAAIADHALEILNAYVPEKTSMLSGLAGKELVSEDEYNQTIDRQKEYMNDARRLVSYEKQMAETKAGIVKLENQKESLIPWQSLSVPMGFAGTKKTVVFIGTLSGAYSIEQVYILLAEAAPGVEALDVEILGVDKDLTYLTVLCLKDEASAVEEALRTNGFARPSQSLQKTPSAVIADLEKDIQSAEDEAERLKKAIEDSRDCRMELRLVGDYYRARARKYEVLGDIPQTEQTFIIQGYVPAKKAQEVISKISNQYQAVVESEVIGEDEDVPVILANNSFSESAEGVLASFGLPAKGEMDPTTIMSFFYVFLFGLMLSDAAYGLIVTVCCAVILKKFPRMGTNMRKSIKLFCWCGLSTLFWGIMFGGYFGDAIDVVSRTFFGHQVTIPAVWFVPLNDPMRMLVYSMLFGVIHLFTGLALKGYMCIKDHKYMDFFCDVVLWFCLLIGLILILLPTDLFSSIAQVQIIFPAAVMALAKGLAIFGAVGIILFSGRSSKNFGVRIALGAYDLYNITGWLSDVLSYSRLLALGLATGVIASVVNQMGSMAGGGIVGALLFIVVFIIGHTFNIAINLLGAYVHTCRLQYVEFFGKFYEGGGRAFEPFEMNTKYVDIKGGK